MGGSDEDDDAVAYRERAEDGECAGGTGFARWSGRRRPYECGRLPRARPRGGQSEDVRGEQELGVAASGAQACFEGVEADDEEGPSAVARSITLSLSGRGPYPW